MNSIAEVGKFDWRLKPFLYCYPLAVLLFLTFFLSPADSIWKPVDEAFFRLLNNTLASGGPWATIVAWANTKIFDTLWAGVMGLLCLWVFLSPRYGMFKDRFAHISAVAVGVVASIAITKLVFKHYDRLSPGRYFDDFVNLNDLLPDIAAKVGSSSSFPGDHGVASVLLVICFIVFFRPWPHLAVIALPIAIINTLPRLIAGGHWFSDVVVGAGSIGLIVYPLLVGTPYLRFVRKVTEVIENRLLQPLMKKTGLRKF